MNSLSGLSGQYPRALQPIYSSKKLHQSIELYKGSLEVSQGQVKKCVDGTIRLDWLPSPQIEFEFSCELNSISSDEVLKLKLPNSADSVEAIVLSLAFHDNQFSATVSGTPTESIVLGGDQNLQYVVFHLTNFYNFIGDGTVLRLQGSVRVQNNSAVFEAEGWKVTIDAINEVTESVKSLKTSAGYGITHVGKIERSDGATFTAEEVQSLLDTLGYFFSFVRGFWIAPILPVGFNKNEEKVWEEWGPLPIIDRWQSKTSWFPDSNATTITPQVLAEVFPSFLQRWQDSSWNEPLRLAIHWYLSSNMTAGAVTGSIILEQAALELLAWVLLVEKGNVSEANFGDKKNKYFNSTSKKINRLLEALKIPTDIPSSLSHLVQFESQLKHSENNGPYALAEVRNSIIHAAPENQQKLQSTSFETRFEAYMLGLRYIELILLHTFGYRGEYSNRLLIFFEDKRRGEEMIETVPWV